MISPVTERLIDFLPLKTSLQFSSQMQLGWTPSTAPKYKTNSVYLEQVLIVSADCINQLLPVQLTNQFNI